jgi:hypothetical protein
MYMKKQLTMFLSGCLMLCSLSMVSAQTVYTVGHATQPDELFASASNDTAICAGSSVSLLGGGIDGTGAYTFSWTPSIGLTSNNTDTTTSTPASTQPYVVTVTDARNCTATAGVTVTVNSLPTATSNGGGPYCVGSTIALTSSGGTDFDWIGPDSYVQANTQNPTILGATVAMDGVYTVTVTNAAGCSITATTTVVVNPLPTATASNTGPYCAGGTIQLNSPAGSATDDWTGPGGYVANNTQNPTRATATVAMSGTYTVTVTDVNGCSATATTSVVVTSCTGLEQIKEIESINLFPNPSEGDLNLSIVFKNKPSSALVEIYNSNGSIILIRNYEKPGTELKDNFNLNEQAAGNYFMRITVGKHSLTSTFIIK